MCNQGSETVEHFLLNCKHFHDIWLCFLTSVKAYTKCFVYFNSVQKLRYILDLNCPPDAIKICCSFVSELYRKRECILLRNHISLSLQQVHKIIKIRVYHFLCWNAVIWFSKIALYIVLCGMSSMYLSSFVHYCLYVYWLNISLSLLHQLNYWILNPWWVIMRTCLVMDRHTHTNAGTDNTWRPKPASGENGCRLVMWIHLYNFTIYFFLGTNMTSWKLFQCVNDGSLPTNLPYISQQATETE